MRKAELIEMIRKVKDGGLMAVRVKVFIAGYLWCARDDKRITWNDFLELIDFAGIEKEQYIAPSEIFITGIQDDTQGYPISF